MARKKSTLMFLDLKFPWCETCRKKYLEALGNEIKCGHESICVNFYELLKKDVIEHMKKGGK